MLTDKHDRRQYNSTKHINDDPVEVGKRSARLKEAWRTGLYDGKQIVENFKGKQTQPYSVLESMTPRRKTNIPK